MKRALLVGIDHYTNFGNLGGCVNDVVGLHPLLERNEDDSRNFECRLVTSRRSSPVRRDELIGHVNQLLAPGPEIALFYFAGHGMAQDGDVALVTSDGTPLTPGVAFSDILAGIGRSNIGEVIVILDCCFSGGATTVAALGSGRAVLPLGLSVLTASRSTELSIELNTGQGEFSSYIVAALEGGAADVLGHVNVAGLYAYVSESFGAWEQRPMFKSNIDRLHDVRKCSPRVPTQLLRKLTEWFPRPDDVFALDPSYEPTTASPHPAHEAVFAGLQRYRSCRLIEPVDEDHMYFAAIHSTGCRLTPLGQHYWRLVKANLI